MASNDPLDFWTIEFQKIYEIMVEAGINGCLCLVGVVNNIITIIAFAKMGFKETTNISFTAIAFWDLIKSLVIGAQLQGTIFFFYDFEGSRRNFNIFQRLVLTQLGDISTHASSMLAVYVAVERCLCVCLPFTGRFLLTRKTTVVTCLAISIIVFGSYSVDYLVLRYVSIRRAVITSFGMKHYQWVVSYVATLNSVYPVVAVCIMGVCTAIIVYHLKWSSKFRSTNAKDGSRQLSTHERKSAKMVVVIITVYVMYLVPRLVFDFAIDNTSLPYYDARLSAFVGPIAQLFSSINSLVNLYIFYLMSSQFKHTLRKMFRLSVDKTPSPNN